MTREQAIQLLGLSTNFTQDDLKKAYREMVKRYHPDVTEGNTVEVFKRIRSAYEILSASGTVGGSNLLTHKSIFDVVRQ